MIKKLYLPLVALLVLAFSSCSKMGELSPDYFTTNPEVLEAIGGKVPVTITGKFPEKYFKKNATVEVTPVLRWEGGEAKGQPATFQGEKVQGNDQTISYKTGGTYTMKASFDYVPEMAKSELYLDFKIKKGKKEYTIPSVKIADGVIATSELPTVNSANAAYAPDAFQRIIKQAKEAQIMFLIQQANLRASELKSDSLKAFHKQVVAVAGDTKNYKLNNIEISAYASPDGGVELNTGLAENREANTEKYMERQLKKGKIDTNLDAKYTAQDWEGFQELVSKSNLQDKDLILRVLSMYNDPEQREAEIKNISSVYKTLADEILPQLRRARLTANYDIIGRSDDEINEAFNSDPKVLSVEELLYAATLTNDNAQGEYYLTDVLQKLNEAGAKVGGISTADSDMVMGINSRKQLSVAEGVMRQRILDKLMDAGVTIMDPASTFIEASVKIGRDTVIYPYTWLEGTTEIGEDCEIGPNARFTNVKIGDDNHLQFIYGHDCEVKNHVTAGPYVHLRPDTVISDHVKIGNYVEVKNSNVGEGTKLPHLTYIGDSDIGSGVNMGCGCITVNYDGKKKHRTVIGDNAFVGCNTNLVAPVTVQANTYIGAGSTITKEVPENALGIARARQKNIEGWAEKYRNEGK